MPRPRRTKTELTIHSNETRVVIGLLILVLGIAVTLAPFLVGQIFDDITRVFGYASVAWGIVILVIAGKLLTKSEYIQSNKTLIGSILLALSLSVFFTFFLPEDEVKELENFSDYGGEIGKVIHLEMFGLLGGLIEFLLLVIILVIAFSLLSGIKLEQINDFIQTLFGRSFEKSRELVKMGRNGLSNGKNDELIGDNLDSLNLKDDLINKEFINTPDKFDENVEFVEEKNIEDEKPQNSMSEAIKTDAEREFIESQQFAKASQSTVEKDIDKDPFEEPKYPNWKFPPTNLLKEPVKKPYNEDLHKRNALIIEKTLRSFQIETRVSKMTIGPTVVQYALSITVGTKVSRVRNLANDIALALATPESQIRIEAPIPGTSLIGIEIPNPTPNFVYIKELIDELNKDSSKHLLPVVLGQNVGAQYLIKDLATLPHMLVAGATGTGKSAAINSLLMGLLMTKSPDELKLILVDPKMVELYPYNGIPHLLTPVITDMELVVNALQWSVDEMLRRYRVLKAAGVRKITEYNEKMGYTAMPFIVIIIDEMADLMLSTGVDVETKIVRLTQMARAVGIHLVLATQRPSVDVITGLIKANIPGRMSLAVSTNTDSRVIIDQPGAETLIGKGDMLFVSPEVGRPIRIQGAFTDTKDVEAVVGFIKDQLTEEVEYTEDVTKPQMDEQAASGGDGRISEDPLLKDALEAVINAQKASASLLQRKLRIGYNRAARLIDELYEAGAIGSPDGSNPRKVLVSSVDEFFNRDPSEDGGVPDEI